MNWKKYLPILDYTLCTSLPASEVQKRIANNIEPKRTEMTIFAPGEFEGDVKEGHFEIYRVFYGRNSFIPKVTGFISGGTEEATVEVKMKFDSALVLIIALMAALFSLFYIIDLRSSFLSGNLSKDLLSLSLRFGIFILAYVLMMVQFRSECSKARKFLLRVLEREEVRMHDGRETGSK